METEENNQSSRSFFSRFNSVRVLLFIYVLVTVAATLSKYFLQGHITNNYLIFTNACGNLINHKDLYIHHPELYNDLYKYSPGFSVLMLPFYYLPDLTGWILWNLLNSLLLFLAVKRLPISSSQSNAILWVILPELVIAVQNAQSNALTAALILFAFISLRKSNLFAGALSAVLATGIKIFGAVSGLVFIFFRRKAAFVLWGIVLFIVSQALPLIFISPSELAAQYTSWFRMLKEDHADAVGLSAMHLLQALTTVGFDFLPVQIAGLLVTLIPLIYTRKYHDPVFQLRFVASLMLAIVLFNHKAESPTFIIAVTGVALWYCMSPRRLFEKILLGFTIIFTSLSPTELAPAVLKEEFFVKYSLKALPCLLVWCVLQYELHFKKSATKALRIH